VEESGPVESISAVTLVTVDMAASVAFYEALGFQLSYGGRRAEFTSFRTGGSHLNLQLDRDRPALSAIWGRIVLWVDDVDAMYRRACSAGMAPAGPPIDAPWGERFFHIRDPDGHELSFARPLAVEDDGMSDGPFPDG
jgi:catechol 2,3-dioxygenase-like lactoylglutathione lyase family enzyme